MCSVKSVVSGELLAVLEDWPPGKAVKEIKKALAARLKVSQFRQRLFENCSSAEELADSDYFEAPEIHLALLEFCPIEEANCSMGTAIRIGDLHSLEELLRRPCQPNMADGLLHLAIKTRQAKALQLLLEAFADAEARDEDGQTPLHLAALMGQSNSMQMLLEAGADKEARDEDGQTPLHLATQMGASNSMQMLLEAGADKEAHDKHGKTPLHLATLMGASNSMQMLLEAGADKEARDEDGQTPLHLASLMGQSNSMQMLLEAGADKEARDEDGQTPLHLATRMGKSTPMQMLLEAGADKEAQDQHGQTPLQQRIAALSLCAWFFILRLSGCWSRLAFTCVHHGRADRHGKGLCLFYPVLICVI